MPTTRIQSIGRIALGASGLIFAIFFLNVLAGGPLGRKPWMGDVVEMLTLFVAVVCFVIGTLAREAAAKSASEAGLDPPMP